VVDDKADIRLSLRFLLSNHHYQVEEAGSLQEAKEKLASLTIDLVLLDMNYQMDTTSGEEGLGFIADISKKAPPIIAMTAWSSVTLAVEAMKVGACDFFAKPWDNHAVLEMINKHLALSAIGKAKNHGAAPEELGEMQWHGEAMLTLQRQISRVAKTDATVLLRGENGTGKTSIAHYIHQMSGAHGPFVSVNVAAIPESLFESELFGHKKGAFTDAKEDREGRFSIAENGTLFLDEIGSLGLEQQAKLLRVLESNEFEPVGDNKTRRANCRIICASNADFDKLIDNGQFRTDLYFRINPIELTVPALRDRLDDILPLARYFTTLHCKKYQLPMPSISPSAELSLTEYHWPGNVRELSHFMARAVLMTDEEQLTESDFDFKSDTRGSLQQSLPLMTLEEAEKKLLNMAMAQSKNNVEEAALLLGISKSAIYRRLDKFSIKTK